MSENKPDFEKLYNDIVAYNANLENELEEYRLHIVPKFKPGQKLYCSDVVNKKVVELKVDEIVINQLGISYREFKNENKFVQFPEKLCFVSEKEAQTKI